ncbi:MAG: hypothetical protein SNJ72_08300 [Fimbriimonadales bacterium]
MRECIAYQFGAVALFWFALTTQETQLSPGHRSALKELLNTTMEELLLPYLFIENYSIRVVAIWAVWATTKLFAQVEVSNTVLAQAVF